MNCKKLILALVIGALGVTAMAQRGPGGGMRAMFSNPLFLVRRDDVKADLALTDDQKTKIATLQDDIQTKMREIFQNSGGDREAAQKDMGPLMEQGKTDLEKILTPDQLKRIKQIQIWISGYSVLNSNKELQDALQLTAAQKSKIASISDTAEAANTSVFEKMRNQEISREDMGTALKKNNDALNAEIEGVLTSDQKAKFKDMEGKTFVSTSQPGFGPRGGGR